MASVSPKALEAVLNAVALASRPLTTTDLASEIGYHKTVAGAAANELVRKGVLVREKVYRRGRRGNAAWGYRLRGSDEAAVQLPAPRTRRPSKLHRGEAPGEIARVIATYNPRGRGFTTRELEKKIKGTSYESIRKAVRDLETAGVIVYAGRCRKHARVYLPVAGKKAVTPPQVTAPVTPAASPAVGSSLTQRVAERDALRVSVPRDTVRLAELEQEFDQLRKLIS